LRIKQGTGDCNRGVENLTVGWIKYQRMEKTTGVGEVNRGVEKITAEWRS
jgi:hypothetical protein